MIEFFGLTLLIMGGLCLGICVLSCCIKEIKQTYNAVVMAAGLRCM